MIPETSIREMLKKHGAARVSKDAAKTFRNELQAIGEEIAIAAVKLSKHGKRKTVSKEDIELALG